MKLSDALEWIRKHNENVGMVRVSFEWRRDGVLVATIIRGSG